MKFPSATSTLPQVSLVLLSLLAAATPLRSAEDGERPPNLIVILTDDQGYGDVGFNGCKDIHTPNLDSIAANGVRFTSGYVTFPVCSPSRAGLLTGRYGQRFGHERNPPFRPNDPKSGLPLTETTLADALGKVGYHCGAIGKWHLGAHADLHPLKRGFHEFFGHLGGGHRYFPEELTIRETNKAKTEEDSYRLWILRNQEPIRTTKYLTDEFSDEAVQFVDRNAQHPFFLYLAYNAPHAPMQATEAYLARFPNITNPKRRTYAAMVSAVDDGVGRLLGRLRELGIADNTLVFFLSDNGGPEEANGSDNGPLRGGKGTPWEGGIRVPFAAQWPARFPKGIVHNEPVSSLDIFATIAAQAGVKIDPARPLDGVDLTPRITEQKVSAPRGPIFLRMFGQGAFAVRQGDDKLVIPKTNSPAELYRLSDDIDEGHNLADQQAERLAELDALRKKWNAELIPPAFEGLESKKKPVAGKKEP